jgi:hypothetical protein
MQKNVHFWAIPFWVLGITRDPSTSTQLDARFAKSDSRETPPQGLSKKINYVFIFE